MKQAILSCIKHMMQTIGLVLVISLAVDYWRKPIAPLHFADKPFTTLRQSSPSTLAQLSQQQTLVVYFWGSWCGICKHTSPIIQKLHEENVAVLGVALRSGSPTDVNAYLVQNTWTFDNINDEHGKWAQQWHVQVTPSILLIRNGQVVHSTTGLSSYWGLKMRIIWANWGM